MTTVSELEERVAEIYEALDLPSWPDPRAGREAPDEEEYSRVTDPGRYRIVHARAHAWAAALEELLGAEVEPLGPPSAEAGLPTFDRGVRVVPTSAEALPLLLLERDAFTLPEQATLAVLDVAVAGGVVVNSEPGCGCDACDSGSRDLLESLDETIRHVVGGPFVVVRGKGWQAQWCPDGWQAGSDGHGHDWEALRRMCRRLAEGDTVALPADAEAFVGRPWVG